LRDASDIPAKTGMTAIAIALDRRRTPSLDAISHGDLLCDDVLPTHTGTHQSRQTSMVSS